MERVREYLDKNGIPYAIINHPKSFTAQETAAELHVPGKQLAKTVIVEAGDRFVMAVLPAHHRVDTGELGKAMNAPARLATEAEFERLFPECELGAMPPFGNLYGLEVWVAEPLMYDEEIVFNCGSHTQACRMKYADFAKVAQPRMANFSTLQSAPPHREPVA